MCIRGRDEVAGACAGRVKVVRINADDHPDLSMWYDIQSIPSLLIFVEGILRDKVVGTVSKEGILTKLRPLVPGLDSPAPPMASAIEPRVINPANAAIIPVHPQRHHPRNLPEPFPERRPCTFPPPLPPFVLNPT